MQSHSGPHFTSNLLMANFKEIEKTGWTPNPLQRLLLLHHVFEIMGEFIVEKYIFLDIRIKKGHFNDGEFTKKNK